MTSGRIGWGKGSEMYHCLGGFRAFEANLPFETSGSELSVVVSALCLGLTMRGRALIVILRSSVWRNLQASPKSAERQGTGRVPVLRSIRLDRWTAQQTLEIWSNALNLTQLIRYRVFNLFNQFNQLKSQFSNSPMWLNRYVMRIWKSENFESDSNYICKKYNTNNRYIMEITCKLSDFLYFNNINDYKLSTIIDLA